ncbi:MAG TPA: hypothetical protein VFX37_05150 [Pseudolabrys sp.]|nr:hypothetical protein [Pseudolabrys sp.]
MTVHRTERNDRQMERTGWRLLPRPNHIQAFARTWKGEAEILTQWVLIIGLFAAVIGVEKNFAYSPANCWVNSAAPFANADWSVRMTVKHGMTCPVWVKTGAAAIDELKIVSPPQKGTVVLRGRTGVTYHPDGAVHGEDFFAFELRGKSHTHAIDSIVKVAVMVE